MTIMDINTISVDTMSSDYHELYLNMTKLPMSWATVSFYENYRREITLVAWHERIQIRLLTS